MKEKMFILPPDPGKREWRLVSETVVPAQYGKAFMVKKGQHLRVYQVEGEQVADCTFWNADDYREVYHTGSTVILNELLGTYNKRWVKYLFSKPPRENIMLTVVEDTVKNHWVGIGCRCSKRGYELRDKIPFLTPYEAPGIHRSCQENLTEAVREYGLRGDDIWDVFLAFQNTAIDQDGLHKNYLPTAKKGDYIEFRAEMNILAAISACPSDTVATNGYRPKPMGVQILDRAET